MKLQLPNTLNTKDLQTEGKRPVRFNFASIILAMVALYGFYMLAQGSRFNTRPEPETVPAQTSIKTTATTEADIQTQVNARQTQPTLFDNQGSQKSVAGANGSMILNVDGIDYPKYILRAGAFIVLLMAGLWWVKKWTKARQGIKGQIAMPMEVLGRRYLGPKQSVVAVKVAEKVLLLGVTETAISLLTTLPTEALEMSDEPDVGNADATHHFADLVSQITRKYQV